MSSNKNNMDLIISLPLLNNQTESSFRNLKAGQSFENAASSTQYNSFITSDPSNLASIQERKMLLTEPQPLNLPIGE